MMSSQSKRGKIYIPLCKNALCESWVFKICEYLDLDCVTKHTINGSYRNHFLRYLKECDFTVLHYCPGLWKRISGIVDTLHKEDRKLILVKFKDYRNEKASSGETSDMNSFFDDFDSEQLIGDDVQDLQSFKDKVFCCLSENSCQQDVPYFDSLSSSEMALTNKECEMEDECAEEGEEEEKEDTVLFGNYPDFNSNGEHLFVCHEMTQLVGYREVSLAKVDPKSLAKSIQYINDLGNRFTEEEVTATLKYILHQMIPDFVKEEDFIRLTSFSMCRDFTVFGRAMDSLELLLWEKKYQEKDFNTLINTQDFLVQALLDLKNDATDDSQYLRMLQRIANVHLIVSGLLLLHYGGKPETSSKCYDYFGTRSRTPFTSSQAFGQRAFALEKPYDVDLCLGALDSVVRGAKKESTSDIIKNVKKQKLPKEKVIKESRTVQLVVVTHLLKEVLSANEDALGSLEQTMDGSINDSPFVFTILHSLTLFLVHKIEKNAHKNISNICTATIDVFKKAIPQEYVEQVDTFLQQLMFNSNPTIREGMIRLFRETDRYGLMSVFLQRRIEEQLSPLLTNFKFQDKSGKRFGWKKATGKFNNLDACIFFYCMTEKDHKNNKTTFADKDLASVEMKRLGSLQHKNIIKMFAYQHGCIPQFYVTENYEQQLQGHLENRRKNDVCYKPIELLQFMLDATAGLQHCHKKGYVHCNLTAESMIVFNDTQVKLAGFGLSKMIHPVSEKADDINSKAIIPLRWSAPESILEGEYSKASDIWMVALVLCEVMTHGLLPYSDLEMSDEELVEQMKLKMLKPTFQPVVERTALLQLLSDCTSYEPESRPYIANVITTLKNILRNAKNIPIRKNMFPPVVDEKLSKHCTRGVPERFQKKTLIRVHKAEVCNIAPGINCFREGGKLTFREKIKPDHSQAMETAFHSPNLDNILPERNILHHSSEKKFIECVIPCENCFNLLDVAFKKRVDTIGEMISLIQKVSAKLAELWMHRYVIGDVCTKTVYVELLDRPKVHIISLAYLKSIGCEDENKDEADFMSEDMKRRASPEVIKHRHFSTKSDVFCFGNFMWELLTAFNAEKQDSFFNKKIKIFKELTKPEEIYDAIWKGEWERHHPKPACCPDNLYKLILSCVNAQENERPSMAQVAAQLHGSILDSERQEPLPSSLVEDNPSEWSGSETFSSFSNSTSLVVANPSSVSSTSA